MKAFSTILCSGAAILLLSGCVADRGYGHNGTPYDNGAYLGGYYDGYYGAYSGGYWSQDGYFYYMDKSHKYHRDDGRHFRRDRFQGGNPIKADDRARDRDNSQDSRNRDKGQDSHDRGNSRDSRDQQDR